jgi:nucleoside-diphosphate-sugar epimerase
MQALIAGSTGLVGSALLDLLLQSANVERVTALVRGSAHAAHPKLDERVARPSLLLGERKEKRVGEGVGSFVGQSLAGAMRGPLRKYRPIFAVSVARALLRLSLEEEPGVFVHESDELARIGHAA